MILRRDDPFGQVVVPDHKKLDRGSRLRYHRGTLRAILRQAGVSAEDFAKWL